MAYAVDVVDGVASVTTVFDDHTLWPELHYKAPLGHDIVHHPPSASGQGGRGHEYHCNAHHIGRGYYQLGRDQIRYD